MVMLRQCQKIDTPNYGTSRPTDTTGVKKMKKKIEKRNQKELKKI